MPLAKRLFPFGAVRGFFDHFVCPDDPLTSRLPVRDRGEDIHAKMKLEIEHGPVGEVERDGPVIGFVRKRDRFHNFVCGFAEINDFVRHPASGVRPSLVQSERAHSSIPRLCQNEHIDICEYIK